MELNAKLRMHNRFDIEVIDARTGEIKQRAQAENVMLNNFFAALGNRYFNYIHLGSGSGTPAVSDTQLFNYEGYCDLGNMEFVADTPNGVAYMRKYGTLLETAYVGVTFTEIGIAQSTSSGLVTHAMLEDMNGNPVSITKTDTDILNIYATVYAHWSQVDMITLDSTWGYDNYGGLISFLFGTKYHTAYENPISGIGFFKSGCPSSNVGGGKSLKLNSYSWDTDHKVLTLLEFERKGVDDGNYGGIKYIGTRAVVDYVNSHMCWSVLIPVEAFYPGDDIEGEAVGTGDGSTTRFYTKFDYPENAKVYVNGVQQTSGVTVRKIATGYYNEYIGPWYKATPVDKNSTSNKIIRRLKNITTPSSGDINTKLLVPESDIVLYEDSVSGFESFTLYSYKISGVNYHTKLYGSNDCGNWTLIQESEDASGSYEGFTYNFNSTTGHYKFYKMVADTLPEGYSFGAAVLTNASEDHKAIVFDTPPANGAVITIDYHTACIAKDSDHVLDVGNFKWTFGEYSE